MFDGWLQVVFGQKVEGIFLWMERVHCNRSKKSVSVARNDRRVVWGRWQCGSWGFDALPVTGTRNSWVVVSSVEKWLEIPHKGVCVHTTHMYHLQGTGNHSFNNLLQTQTQL